MGKDFQIVGTIGVCLWGIFASLLAVLLYKSISRYGWKSNQRQWFLVVSLVTGLFDMIYFASLISLGQIEKFGYACHILSTFFHLVSVTMVILLWARHLSLGGTFKTVQRVVWVVLFLNGIITLVTVGSLIFGSESLHNFTGKGDVWYLTSLTADGICLFFFICWLFIYGVRLLVTINRAYTDEDEGENRVKMKGVFNIVIFLLVCTVCFGWRIFLLFDLMVQVTNDTDGLIDFKTHYSWWVFGYFLPYFIPYYIMAYVMRDRKSLHQEELDQNLLVEEYQQSNLEGFSTTGHFANYFGNGNKSGDGSSSSMDQDEVIFTAFSRFDSQSFDHPSNLRNNRLKSRQGDTSLSSSGNGSELHLRKDQMSLGSSEFGFGLSFPPPSFLENDESSNEPLYFSSPPSDNFSSHIDTTPPSSPQSSKDQGTTDGNEGDINTNSNEPEDSRLYDSNSTFQNSNTPNDDRDDFIVDERNMSRTSSKS